MHTPAEGMPATNTPEPYGDKQRGRLAEELDAAFLGIPGKTSALVADMDEDVVLYDRRSRDMTRAAACMKPFVMSALADRFYQKATDRSELEGLLPSEHVIDADGDIPRPIEEMLSWLDEAPDDALDACIELGGGIEKVSDFIRWRFDLANTRMNRLMTDATAMEEGRENYTTLHDIRSALMDIMFPTPERGNLFAGSDIHREAILTVLQGSADSTGIVRLVSDRGEWKGMGAELPEFSLCHDAGVMVLGNRHLFMGIFTEYTQMDAYEVRRAMGEFGKIACDWFEEACRQG